MSDKKTLVCGIVGIVLFLGSAVASGYLMGRSAGLAEGLAECGCSP